MALRKAQRLVSSCSQMEAGNVLKRGSASIQATGGGSPSRMGSQPRGLFQSEQGLYLFFVPLYSEPNYLERRHMRRTDAA